MAKRPAHYRNGVRSGRKPEPTQCIRGYGIRPETKRLCQACGVGPIHPSQGCAEGCSFLRSGKLVCRDCAIAYDVVYRGGTQIVHDLGFTALEIKEALAIAARAQRVKGPE